MILFWLFYIFAHNSIGIFLTFDAHPSAAILCRCTYIRLKIFRFFPNHTKGCQNLWIAPKRATPFTMRVFPGIISLWHHDHIIVISVWFWYHIVWIWEFILRVLRTPLIDNSRNISRLWYQFLKLKMGNEKPTTCSRSFKPDESFRSFVNIFMAMCLQAHNWEDRCSKIIQVPYRSNSLGWKQSRTGKKVRTTKGH